MAETAKGEVQTRDDVGALRFFNSVMEAFTYAEENKAVWKVSFWVHQEIHAERVRFVRGPDNTWIFEPII